MTVDVRRPVPLRELIRASFRAYGANFRAFFLIALATAPMQMLTAVILDRIDDDETRNAVSLPLRFADTIIVLVVTAAIVYAANAVANGSLAEAGPSLDAALSRFGAIVSTQFLYAIAGLASVVAFPYTAYRYWQDIQQNEPRGALTALGVIVGALFYFFVRWSLSVQSVMLSGHRNWAALDESADLIFGEWWRTLGIVLAFGLAVFPASLVAASASYMPALAGATVSGLALAFVLPFVIIGQTLLFLDLKARKRADAISPS